ncbi:MAG: CvpA family protein [Ruminococcus sp.]|nr:CvpA family protein [Ruminococcus sp.]MBR2282989.1 CvpA family protein [Ruminococcus sp.]
MGSQFWWIYDAAAAAVVLVCIFVMGKKGTLRSMIALVCAGVALAAAYGASGAISNFIYDNNIRSSTIKKIEKNLEKDTFNEKLAEYIESLGYGVDVKATKLGETFFKDGDIDDLIYKYVNNINGKKAADEAEFKEQLHEGYAKVIKDIASKELASYAASDAARMVLEDSSSIKEFGQLAQDELDRKPAAELFADEFTAPAYRKVIRYVSFIALFVIIAVLAFLLIRAFTGSDGYVGAVSHIMGGIFGIVFAAAIIFVIAVMIRLYVLMGSNEMMIFNKDTIDSTYVFKYFYDLVLKM